jgi:hypothetical protein
LITGKPEYATQKKTAPEFSDAGKHYLLNIADIL